MTDVELLKIAAKESQRGVSVATMVRIALERDLWVPKTVTAKVQEGAIVLEGTVAWNFERDSAERTVRDLRAAEKICNNIVVGS